MDTPRSLDIEQDVLLLPSRTGASSRSTAQQYAKLRLWTALTDALSLDAAILVTRLIRFGLRPVGIDFIVLLLVAPLVWLAIFAMFRLYSARLTPAEEFRRIFEATVVGIGAKVVATYLTGEGAGSVLNKGWIGLTWVITVVAVLATRQAWHKYVGRRRRDGMFLYRTVIVGANAEGMHLAESLKKPQSGFAPMGVIRTDHGWAPWDGLPVLGTFDELDDIVSTYGVECVFVATSSLGPNEMKVITKSMRQHGVEVRVSANITDILASRLSVQPVGDLLALSLRPVQLSGRQAVAKRAFDLTFASLALIVGIPIWLAITVLIKMTSRGPVLYRQVRVGQNGKPFTIYKFRTMVRGADLLLDDLASRNEASGPLFKIRDDPRVTTVGKWLRTLSLDEVPQLINVVKGDMSLVGPRPPLPNEVARYEDWHRDRLQVKPGITGLWQVRGRSELTFDDYVRLDLFYIENWSIMYDVFILAKTLPAVLFRKGAY